MFSESHGGFGIRAPVTDVYPNSNVITNMCPSFQCPILSML